MNPKKILVVVGPTAVGKTDEAIRLALQHHCPIISCDSRQLYSELNIGVAKPDAEQLQTIQHYFIGNISIHEHYTAGKYANDARQLINSLFETYDTLVVCGGTGLYVNALFNGLDQLPERDEELRNELNQLLNDEGIETLQRRLKSEDVDAYNKVDIHNPQRLMRAIEIAESKKITIEKAIEFQHKFTTDYIVMEMDREKLYDRINTRVDKMIEQGLEEEAKSLYPMRHLNALQTVGYSEWWPYFEGEVDKAFVIEKIKQHTRNYAKRQMTWFRNKGIM